MATATITVQYVNAPKEGRFSGSIKDTNGKFWDIPGDKVEAYQAFKGKTVAVQYKENERGYKTITGIMGSAAPSATGTSSTNAEDIFVTGIVGRAMGSGKFEPRDIGWLTQEAVAAYRTWKDGSSPQQQEVRRTVDNSGRSATREMAPSDELDDRIPF